MASAPCSPSSRNKCRRFHSLLASVELDGDHAVDLTCAPSSQCTGMLSCPARDRIKPISQGHGPLILPGTVVTQFVTQRIKGQFRAVQNRRLPATLASGGGI
jgi:hypothetical protein